MKNIVVIYGGDSCESDISIITAMQTIPKLDKSKYKIYCVLLKNNEMFLIKKGWNIKNYLKWNEKKHTKVWINKGKLMISKPKSQKLIANIDCALLCTHGGSGEDGTLQGFLEINNIPYTSCGVNSSAVGMDKVLSKLVFESLGLNVLPYVVLKKTEYKKKNLDKAIENLKFPIIVKPNNQGSSIGIDIAHNIEELEQSISIAFEYSDNILLEKALEGCVELNCACYADKNELIVSAIEKPVKWQGFLTFEDKYIAPTTHSQKIENENKSQFNNWNDQNKENQEREYPANISKEKTREIQLIVHNVYDALGMNGIVRFDFLMDSDQEIYINEFNTIPGSLAFYLYQDKNISFTMLLDKLIETAVDTKTNKKVNKYQSEVLNNYNKKWSKGCKIK